MSQIQRGLRFQQLHTAEAIFLMPNAWDVGSALMLASCGFPAIATTSAGVAFSLGFPDQEAAVSRETMLDRVGSIAAASPLPVSADLQSGYGASPEEVGETIAAAIRAGVVGANIEDYSGNPAQALFDREHAVARVRAARRAADASGVPFVLTARSDVYLTGASNVLQRPSSDAMRTERRVRIASLCRGFRPQDHRSARPGDQCPLTVVMGLTGSPLTVPQLGSLGVRRVTVGGSLARATFGLIRRAAQEMAASGTFSYADQQIPDAELSQFFEDQRGSGFAM